MGGDAEAHHEDVGLNGRVRRCGTAMNRRRELRPDFGGNEVDSIDWALFGSIPSSRNRRESRRSSWHAWLLTGRRLAAALGGGHGG
jgi:hypothetical protein